MNDCWASPVDASECQQTHTFQPVFSTYSIFHGWS